MKKIMIVLLSTLALWGCGSSSLIIDYKGGKVDIELKNNSISAELISVQDDELIVVYMKRVSEFNQINKIASINFNDIKSISAQPYDNTAKSSVLYFQIIPAAIVGIVAASYSESSYAIAVAPILMIPGLITYLIYNSAIPEPFVWRNSMPVTLLNEFRPYARVPYALSDEQLTELLKLYHQDKIETLK
jgi:hypothetical protein